MRVSGWWYLLLDCPTYRSDSYAAKARMWKPLLGSTTRCHKKQGVFGGPTPSSGEHPGQTQLMEFSVPPDPDLAGSLAGTARHMVTYDTIVAGIVCCLLPMDVHTSARNLIRLWPLKFIRRLVCVTHPFRKTLFLYEMACRRLQPHLPPEFSC